MGLIIDKVKGLLCDECGSESEPGGFYMGKEKEMQTFSLRKG